jgi:signal peptidase II
VVKRPLRCLIATATLAVALDQMSKALVRASIGPNETVTVIPGVLEIVHVRNAGAAFGMLQGRQTFLIAVAVFMLCAVAVYWWRVRPRSWPIIVPLGLVVGGALGNLYDRVVAGHVTDFLAFSFFAPVYNLADSAIVVGVATLVAWVLFSQPKEPLPAGAAGATADDASARGASDAADDAKEGTADDAIVDGGGDVAHDGGEAVCP